MLTGQTSSRGHFCQVQRVEYPLGKRQIPVPALHVVGAVEPTPSVNVTSRRSSETDQHAHGR